MSAVTQLWPFLKLLKRFMLFKEKLCFCLFKQALVQRAGDGLSGA